MRGRKFRTPSTYGSFNVPSLTTTADRRSSSPVLSHLLLLSSSSLLPPNAEKLLKEEGGEYWSGRYTRSTWSLKLSSLLFYLARSLIPSLGSSFLFVSWSIYFLLGNPLRLANSPQPLPKPSSCILHSKRQDPSGCLSVATKFNKPIPLSQLHIYFQTSTISYRRALPLSTVHIYILPQAEGSREDRKRSTINNITHFNSPKMPSILFPRVDCDANPNDTACEKPSSGDKRTPIVIGTVV